MNRFYLSIRAFTYLCFIFLILLLASGCEQLGILPTPVITDARVDILFYASADNRDNDSVSADVKEFMEGIPASGYQFWVLYDSPSSQDVPKPGFYRGQDGYWEKIPLSDIGLADKGVLNMGDGTVLTAVLSHTFTADRTSILILAGESGAVYQGLLLDQGSNDYLQVQELSNSLATLPHAVDLLVMDTSFSAGFEFLYEIGTSMKEPPMTLLSPGPIPRKGRNYASLFSSYALPPVPSLPPIARHIRDSFLANYASDARTSQVIADPSKAKIFLEKFNHVLEDVHSATTENSSRTRLRTQMMFATPSYYETPGNLHIGLAGILAAFQQELGSSLNPILMQDCVQSLSNLYPSWAGTNPRHGELSLFFVPLLSNGSPHPSYDPAYSQAQGDLAFVKDAKWCANANAGTGLLYRLWIEALP